MAKLYLVPTPIGNLEDVTLRALRVLREVDIIYAEDTRTSSVFLKKYEITTPLASHHKFNEHRGVEIICDKIESGINVALISDAGTPGISDPGFLLVRTAISRGVEVETLPGATAFVPALVNSGFPTDRFCFEGFLPIKKGRQTKMKELAQEGRSIVIYESPYRLVKTLLQLGDIMEDNRRASVSRELTKIYEETRRGTLKELAEWYSAHEPKGEIVLIIEGRDYVGKGERDEEE